MLAWLFECSLVLGKVEWVERVMGFVGWRSWCRERRFGGCTCVGGFETALRVDRTSRFGFGWVTFSCFFFCF